LGLGGSGGEAIFGRLGGHADIAALWITADAEPVDVIAHAASPARSAATCRHVSKGTLPSVALVIRAAREVFPRDTILGVDVGALAQHIAGAFPYFPVFGPRSTIVPTLLGDSDRAAQLRLQQDGLELAGISEVRSSEYPPDAVIAQNPEPKSSAPKVAILVNRAERGATYVMPDLIGVNGDRAADLLRARAFRVAVVGDHPYPGVPAGIVLRQSPQGGYQVSPGDAISLEVSR